MFDYYNLDIVPIILNRFKVNNIVVSGLSDGETLNQVNEYTKNSNASVILIDSKDFDGEYINDYTLNVLPELNNFEAIFLNDDPNWYTVFNELNIIKNNNEEFPLVFICHNVFPHKRRDSYLNPESIPDEFLNEYSQYLTHTGVDIKDGFYHALNESTPKNGVLTAIEDFLAENPSVGIMDIKLLNGIIILYKKDSISQIRIGRLLEEIEGHDLEFDDLSDNIVENQILKNYLIQNNVTKDTLDIIDDYKQEISEKNKLIKDFEGKIDLHDTELSYKNSQINSFDSKLDLKDTQIKNIESQLVNRENEINTLNNQINSLKNEFTQKESSFKNNESELNNQILELKNNLSQKEKHENDLNNQLQDAKNQIRSNLDEINNKNVNINFKDHLIKQKDDVLAETAESLKTFKKQYTNQLAKLDNKEYCISCYQEEITNNHMEIEYLKNDNLTKKVLSPFAYLYILLKSNPKELSINFKLYRALKNSKCFDIGYYLNNNSDLKDSKWCKYFSPELHYVCNGFKEQRKFNKKYFNRNSKHDLMGYLLTCNEL